MWPGAPRPDGRVRCKLLSIDSQIRMQAAMLCKLLIVRFLLEIVRKLTKKQLRKYCARVCQPVIDRCVIRHVVLTQTHRCSSSVWALGYFTYL
jgi:hypothetical protein